MRTVAALALTLAIAACGPIIPASSPPVIVNPAVPPASAVLAGVAAASARPLLKVRDEDASGALHSFLESCPRLLSREDQSGLTQTSDWSQSCNAARNWPNDAARNFFATQFVPVRVGSGEAFATGYFEPEIRGSRTKVDGYMPVYAMPDDLVRDWPVDVPGSERIGRPPLGRFDKNGDFVRYYERAQIEQGVLDRRVPVIAWAADPVEFFFLQIQGSGRLRTDDGEVIRIGYAGQNGRDYVGIGGVMRERGLLGDGPGQYAGSMQGIMAYIRENPGAGRDLMWLNKSWIFFRELTGDGPLGALEVPVRANSSIAADPRYVPLGAPVWLDLDRDEADGLWIAQDTGGAIKGANRFDTFWGSGEEARRIAGGMSGRGEALILLPAPAARRLITQP